jgi:leucyl aminopeptidase
MNLNGTIKATKDLINLPHNKFNLSNYRFILEDKVPYINFESTPSDLPIQLMSGRNYNSGLIRILPRRVSDQGNIYIIGKGILFDSGGLDLKRSMVDMSNDKAGMLIAVAVADYFHDIPKGIFACCPVTTNFVQNSLIIPGDVLTIGKKEVKITNTDAEGRLILAEALTACKLQKKDIVITIATLTGAVEGAIDKRATGVFGTNDTLVNQYLTAATQVKELAWRLPLWADLEKAYYKGNKIKNYVKEIKAGATEAALFVKQFVPYPENWIHLDIAASAFDKNNKANGVPIKSLVKFIENLK